MTESNVPLPKGAFVEYDDVICKYSWITDVIGRVLMNKLLKLITLIETMTESNVPLPKGAFVEYDDVICKYSWITDVIGRVLMNKYFLA